MADTYNLKVNTEQLKEIADSTRASIDKAKDVFTNLEKTATKVNTYWEGRGETAHMACFQKSADSVEPILDSFYNMVDSLLQVAGIYETAEKQNISDISVLPDDVIS